MKRALILGGGGFIGNHLARRLSGEGCWVRCVDLKRPCYFQSTANEFLVGDLRDAKISTAALAGGFDEVYDLAGDVNVLGASIDVGRIFCASSAGLANIFGPEMPWESGNENVVAELCRKIAMAEPSGEIEIWSDDGKPGAFFPIDECLDDILRLVRADVPVNLGSYSLTVQQLARMIMEVAGKTVSLRNIACRISDERPSEDRRARLGFGANSPLKKGLTSTYEWVKTQLNHAAAPAPSIAIRTKRSDNCLLDRAREATRGRDLIDWADTNFRSLLEQLGAIHLSDFSQMKNGLIYHTSTLGHMVRMHAACRTSHVLITRLDENWGAFSSHIQHRTYPQVDWDVRVIKEGCTLEEVRQYLDDPLVKAVGTLQHTAISHPTILSIPIGIHNPQVLLDHISRADGEKTQELLINNNAWVDGDREHINDRIIAKFGGGLRNTYGLPLPEFYESVIRSKFVLCPSGMGLDTHRLWETLILGSIPIVEYCTGWNAVLDDLPALWVTDFDEVTPALLASAYRDIHSKCDRFDFGKLTSQWWTKRIKGLLDAR